MLPSLSISHFPGASPPPIRASPPSGPGVSAAGNRPEAALPGPPISTRLRSSLPPAPRSVPSPLRAASRLEQQPLKKSGGLPATSLPSPLRGGRASCHWALSRRPAVTRLLPAARAEPTSLPAGCEGPTAGGAGRRVSRRRSTCPRQPLARFGATASGSSSET